MTKSVPKHVAIIMDGNGRWAKEKGLPLLNGHKKGADTAFEIVSKAQELGVSWITLYTFSTENWKRPTSWINNFKSLLTWYLENEISKLMQNNVRFHVIGDIEAFGENISNRISAIIQKTEKNTGINLVIALNYGSRAEILKATKNIAKDIKNENLKEEDLDEHIFSKYLSTHFMPDPDLLIRTSGEYRISNYLLWQIAYSELAFSKNYWPDFTPDEFKDIILEYQNRERRYGQYLDSK